MLCARVSVGEPFSFIFSLSSFSISVFCSIVVIYGCCLHKMSTSTWNRLLLVVSQSESDPVIMLSDVSIAPGPCSHTHWRMWFIVCMHFSHSLLGSPFGFTQPPSDPSPSLANPHLTRELCGDDENDTYFSFLFSLV